MGTEKSGGTSDYDSDRGEFGKDNKDREDYTKRPHAGGEPTDPDGDGGCTEADRPSTVQTAEGADPVGYKNPEVPDGCARGDKTGELADICLPE